MKGYRFAAEKPADFCGFRRDTGLVQDEISARGDRSGRSEGRIVADAPRFFDRKGRRSRPITPEAGQLHCLLDSQRNDRGEPEAHKGVRTRDAGRKRGSRGGRESKERFACEGRAAAEAAARTTARVRGAAVVETFAPKASRKTIWKLDRCVSPSRAMPEPWRSGLGNVISSRRRLRSCPSASAH
ncbi:hypothetical protein J2R99_002206 [Rhodopseudomonas julia]|uniref:Uncharacterized protein n=1 Tax=Rhodopseudomonas julia TaxID=200617 RepID=A0ABU0C734_9BRAD|nr:hypothetical protein [Rhodopseudomonas julia]